MDSERDLKNLKKERRAKKTAIFLSALMVIMGLVAMIEGRLGHPNSARGTILLGWEARLFGAGFVAVFSWIGWFAWKKLRALQDKNKD